MKEETKTWLKFSLENFESAKILLESQLYNPCLQNVQQSIEKSLKSLLIEYSLPLKKTHSINELQTMLSNANIQLDLLEEECDFIDSIYLPSKYPLGSALPDFDPDVEICKNAISIAEKIIKNVRAYLKS